MHKLTEEIVKCFEPKKTLVYLTADKIITQFLEEAAELIGSTRLTQMSFSGRENAMKRLVMDSLGLSKIEPKCNCNSGPFHNEGCYVREEINKFNARNTDSKEDEKMVWCSHISIVGDYKKFWVQKFDGRSWSRTVPEEDMFCSICAAPRPKKVDENSLVEKFKEALDGYIHYENGFLPNNGWKINSPALIPEKLYKIAEQHFKQNSKG